MLMPDNEYSAPSLTEYGTVGSLTTQTSVTKDDQPLTDKNNRSGDNDFTGSII